MKTSRFAASLALLATVTACLLRSAIAGAEPPPNDEAVVPAGQEELLAEMLGRGATLPDGCKLSEGKIEYTTVKATYACPNGNVVFELSHPSRAGGEATRTDRFALTLKSGSPPEGLVPDLVSRIRSREAAFEWKWAGAASSARWPSNTALAGGVLLAIALLGWIVRSRSSARRVDSR
jgi:hypothetical protein